MQHKLYAMRKAKNLTQEEMASVLNVSTVTYRAKEKSKIPFNADEMFMIASYFNTDMNDIFIPRV